MNSKSSRVNIKSSMTLLLILFAPGLASSGEINTGPSGKVAIYGYDPVSYFTENRPMQGSDDIALEWLGAKWHFANDVHKQMFSADPIRYAPQYGGHCADGIAAGWAVDNIDPNAWYMIDDKLYLFHNKEIMARFLDRPGKLERSIAKWPRLKEKLRDESN